MKSLESVIAAAAEVEGFCREKGWSFCFIGGIAVQRWGMPRFTQDVDTSLFTGLGTEAEFVEDLLGRFAGRMSDARRFALEHRVVLARTGRGVALDFSLGAFPFEWKCIERASIWKVEEGITLTTCSAEDLVVHKVFAGRDRDWADVEGVWVRQGGQLKQEQIRRDLVPLLELKEEPESMAKLDRLIAAVERRRRS
jgi:hypothetical protein